MMVEKIGKPTKRRVLDRILDTIGHFPAAMCSEASIRTQLEGGRSVHFIVRLSAGAFV